jgi:alpha-glucoside transport system permease protein
MVGTLIRAVAFIVIGVGGAAFFFYAGNYVTEHFMPQQAGDRLRPYIFILPALFVVTVYLLYPLLDTFRRSFYADRFEDGARPFVGIDNYRDSLFGDGIPPVAWVLFAALIVIAIVMGMTSRMEALDRRRNSYRTWLFVALGVVILAVYILQVLEVEITSGSPAWSAIWNNVLWLVVVPSGSVAIGLLVAVLADRLNPKAESLAKSMIFMPMAISFVGASVVWTLVYDISTTGNQVGLLNGIVRAFGADPIPWLEREAINDFALMVIMIWLQAGFAMVLLSAAIKSVPEDTLEAARIDGASEFQIFWRVVVPQIRSTIVVVLTTILILVLKVFDIVRVLTNGRDDTQVVANLFFTQFENGAYGTAGVLVMVLVVATIPFMVINIKRFREQEATR